MIIITPLLLTVTLYSMISNNNNNSYASVLYSCLVQYIYIYALGISFAQKGALHIIYVHLLLIIIIMIITMATVIISCIFVQYIL